MGRPTVDYNAYPTIKEINFSTVDREDIVFYEGLHTVVFVSKTKSGGVGMGEYPSYVTVVCDTGLVFGADGWSHKPKIRKEPFQDIN